MLLLLAHLAWAAGTDDGAEPADAYRIASLPGLAQPAGFDQYAGYLDVDSKNHGRMFFWLMESMAGGENDPLIIWLNGGPGDSSLNGLFWENGPLRLSVDGRMSVNPHAWNRHASVLYLDQPLGTGFSTVDDVSRVRTSAKMVQDFYAFLEGFYRLFPSYRQRPLFLTGESSAGHYIPHFARAILDRNKQGDGIRINLAGLAIGNGWIDPLIQMRSYPQFVHGAGLIDAAQKAQAAGVYAEIRREILEGRADESTFNKAIGSVLVYTGTQALAVNMYDIRRLDPNAGFEWPKPALLAMSRYLARDDVRRAIHADGFTGKYQGFSLDVYRALQAYHYSSTRQLLSELRAELPILLYVGQYDLVSNHLGFKDLLAALEWPEGESIASAPRYVWIVDGKPAGYARTQGRLTFLMVLGGSHMVPYSVPGPAQDMIERFIAGRSFGDFLPKPISATASPAGQ